MAWKRAYDGKPHPLHFDLEIVSGSYRKVERYTLMDAAYSDHVYRAGEIVGAVSASSIRQRRPASVPADATAND